jgi:hypothetical protein
MELVMYCDELVRSLEGSPYNSQNRNISLNHSVRSLHNGKTSIVLTPRNQKGTKAELPSLFGLLKPKAEIST